MNRPESQRDLAADVRRFMMIAGYALGGWWLLGLIVNLAAWWPDSVSSVRSLSPYAVARSLTLLLYVAAYVLLIVGWWFHQRHRREGRMLLMVYIATWIAQAISSVVVTHIGIAGFDRDQTSWQYFGYLAAELMNIVGGAVYPVALFFYLRHPATKDEFSKSGSAFTPIFAQLAQATDDKLNDTGFGNSSLNH